MIHVCPVGSYTPYIFDTGPVCLVIGTHHWEGNGSWQPQSRTNFWRSSFSLSAPRHARHVRRMAGLIAIVGRPNVGKSALFNRIAGRRIAIVHDQPGVTRDRVTAEVEWHGTPFTLVDTGGIGLLRREKAADAISKAAIEQVQLAIEAADVIILVVN